MLIIPGLFLLTVVGALINRVRLPALRIDPTAGREEKTQILDRWFSRLHSAGKFNGVVLICKNGEVVFSACCGDDGAEPPETLTLNSSFNLASVSKHITAYCILLLHHRGKLQLDDLLVEHIPEMSQYTRVTLQHLLHHMSGIPDYMALARSAGFSKSIFTTDDMLQLFLQEMPDPDFSAGEKFRYSNTGYVLLAEVVARNSGKSFEAFCQSELFDPLGMKHSRVFNLISDTGFPGRVYGFKKSWFSSKRKQLDLNRFDGVLGDGAVYSSAEDLKIWHEALGNSAMIPENVMNMAYDSGLLNNGAKTNYGNGWFIGPDGGVEHSGGWQGFTSFLHRNLRSGDLVVLLDNSGNTMRVNGMGFRFHSIGVNLRACIEYL